MNTTTINGAAAHHDHDHDHAPAGIMRWLTSTNHKDIGTLYLWFSLFMFFFAGALAMVIRAEPSEPSGTDRYGHIPREFRRHLRRHRVEG